MSTGKGIPQLELIGLPGINFCMKQGSYQIKSSHRRSSLFNSVHAKSLVFVEECFFINKEDLSSFQQHVDGVSVKQQGPSMKVFGAQRRFDAVNDESFCSCIASCYLNTAFIFYEKVPRQSLCSNLPGKLTSSLFKSFFHADLIDSLDQPGNLTIGL